MKVLLSGATGFIGRALAARLAGIPEIDVTVATRDTGASVGNDVGTVRVGPLGPNTDWGQALQGVNIVVHAAAIAHSARRFRPSLYEELRRVNVLGTMNLARQAVQAGASRFIFFSTVKVNGSTTAPGRPFRFDDQPAPDDIYGSSKYEAEVGLKMLATKMGLEVVIVRPPLVYGPGVKANFLSLMTWIDRGVPLPFLGVRNRRSLIYLENLIDFVSQCVLSPEASGETFLVSDEESLSTEELVRRLALQMEKPVRLFRLPSAAFGLVSRLPGGDEMRTRLFCSLEIDSERARNRLDWKPPYTIEEGLADTVRWYREQRSRTRSKNSWSARFRV